MIDECDLTGVEKLVIGNISMTSDLDNYNYDNNSSNNNYNFKSIAQKLVNVKRIVVDKMQNDTLEFLQALTPILDNNKDCEISLSFPSTIKKHCAVKQQEFFYFILDNQWNVTEISLVLNSDTQSILREILNSDYLARTIETLKLSVHKSFQDPQLFLHVKDIMMYRLNPDSGSDCIEMIMI